MPDEARNFKEHNQIFSKLNAISEDMAVIKNIFIGDDGLVKTVKQHERQWNENKGSMKVMYTLLIVILLPIALLAAEVFWK